MRVGVGKTVWVAGVQISADYVLQHRTLSTRLRSYHCYLRQIDGILYLYSRMSVSVPQHLLVPCQVQHTPTVVKTSWSLLTRVMSPGSLTLILYPPLVCCPLSPHVYVLCFCAHALGFVCAMAGDAQGGFGVSFCARRMVGLQAIEAVLVEIRCVALCCTMQQRVAGRWCLYSRSRSMLEPQVN